MNPTGGYMVDYDIADFFNPSEQYCFQIELALRGGRADLLQKEVGMPCWWRAHPAWYVLRLYRGHVIHRNRITALEAYAIWPVPELGSLSSIRCDKTNCSESISHHWKARKNSLPLEALHQCSLRTD